MAEEKNVFRKPGKCNIPGAYYRLLNIHIAWNPIIIITIIISDVVGGRGENGGPQYFFDRAIWKGGLERSKGALVGGGGFLIKVRNFHLPYFGIV